MPRPTLDQKAEQLLREGGVRQDRDHPQVWWVQGQGGLYRVQVSPGLDGGQPIITCTCPHGLKVGGGSSDCYHVRAVLLAIEMRSD